MTNENNLRYLVGNLEGRMGAVESSVGNLHSTLSTSIRDLREDIAGLRREFVAAHSTTSQAKAVMEATAEMLTRMNGRKWHQRVEVRTGGAVTAVVGALWAILEYVVPKLSGG